MKTIAITILFFFGLISKLEAAAGVGPVGKITLNSISECPEKERPTGGDITWSAKLSELGGKKVISGYLNGKNPVDDTQKFTLVIKRWEDGNWKKCVEISGHPCTEVQKLVPKLWAKTVEQIKPDPGRKCPAPAGNFSIENFHAHSKDLDLKAIFYGKLLIKATNFDKNKKLIFCAIAEGESEPL